jgi:hypothetical protein
VKPLTPKLICCRESEQDGYIALLKLCATVHAFKKVRIWCCTQMALCLVLHAIHCPSRRATIIVPNWERRGAAVQFPTIKDKHPGEPISDAPRSRLLTNTSDKNVRIVIPRGYFDPDTTAPIRLSCEEAPRGDPESRKRRDQESNGAPSKRARMDDEASACSEDFVWSPQARTAFSAALKFLTLGSQANVSTESGQTIPFLKFHMVETTPWLLHLDQEGQVTAYGIIDGDRGMCSRKRIVIIHSYICRADYQST